MIAILQPFVPHYREKFFNGLHEQMKFDLYCYQDTDKLKQQHFEQGKTHIKPMDALKAGPFVLYDPLPFFRKDYKMLVLMLDFAHLSTWLLLFLKPFLRKKIILWGHGISVKRYVNEEKKPNILLKWMMALSDGTWFYTNTELAIWKTMLPDLNGYALNNTISGIEEILTVEEKDKAMLKEKYGIVQPRIIIYCARFNEKGRRVDLLLNLIEQLDPERFGCIVIGDGNLKPDFSGYAHVYDFGAVYNREVKDELFSIADVYFQPGWVGLSIVEAMAYCKPVFTFKRSKEVMQCVEYSYLQQGHNGVIFNDLASCLQALNELADEDIRRMGNNAREFVKRHLTMSMMIATASGSIKTTLLPQ